MHKSSHGFWSYNKVESPNDDYVLEKEHKPSNHRGRTRNTATLLSALRREASEPSDEVEEREIVDFVSRRGTQRSSRRLSQSNSSHSLAGSGRSSRTQRRRRSGVRRSTSLENLKQEAEERQNCFQDASHPISNPIQVGPSLKPLLGVSNNEEEPNNDNSSTVNRYSVSRGRSQRWSSESEQVLVIEHASTQLHHQKRVGVRANLNLDDHIRGIYVEEDSSSSPIYHPNIDVTEGGSSLSICMSKSLASPLNGNSSTISRPEEFRNKRIQSDCSHDDSTLLNLMGVPISPLVASGNTSHSARGSSSGLKPLGALHQRSHSHGSGSNLLLEVNTTSIHGRPLSHSRHRSTSANRKEQELDLDFSEALCIQTVGVPSKQLKPSLEHTVMEHEANPSGRSGTLQAAGHSLKGGLSQGGKKKHAPILPLMCNVSPQLADGAIEQLSLQNSPRHQVVEQARLEVSTVAQHDKSSHTLYYGKNPRRSPRGTPRANGYSPRSPRSPHTQNSPRGEVNNGIIAPLLPASNANQATHDQQVNCPSSLSPSLLAGDEKVQKCYSTSAISRGDEHSALRSLPPLADSSSPSVSNNSQHSSRDMNSSAETRNVNPKGSKMKKKTPRNLQNQDAAKQAEYQKMMSKFQFRQTFNLNRKNRKP